MGSNSLQTMFKLSGKQFRNMYKRTRHFNCGKVGYCGVCMREAIENKQPPLSSCGNFTVWSQIDYPLYEKCFFPQVSAIQEIYNDAPDAVFLLPFREINSWFHSVFRWRDLLSRMSKCDLPGLPR